MSFFDYAFKLVVGTLRTVQGVPGYRDAPIPEKKDGFEADAPPRLAQAEIATCLSAFASGPRAWTASIDLAGIDEQKRAAYQGVFEEFKELVLPFIARRGARTIPSLRIRFVDPSSQPGEESLRKSGEIFELSISRNVFMRNDWGAEVIWRFASALGGSDAKSWAASVHDDIEERLRCDAAYCFREMPCFGKLLALRKILEDLRGRLGVLE